MIMRLSIIKVFLLLIAFQSFQTASANLVQNGSFENGSFVNTSANYMVLNSGDTALTDWVITSQLAWGLSPTDGNTASDGLGFVDLSGLGNQSPNGELQQTINTMVGTQYLFSYDRLGSASDVSIDGTSLTLPGTLVSGWTTYTSIFTATSALSLLAITNVTPSSQIVFIDNISITAIGGSAVPVPAAVWLFGSALIGLIGFSKRRKEA